VPKKREREGGVESDEVDLEMKKQRLDKLKRLQTFLDDCEEDIDTLDDEAALLSQATAHYEDEYLGGVPGEFESDEEDEADDLLYGSGGYPDAYKFDDVAVPEHSFASRRTKSTPAVPPGDSSSDESEVTLSSTTNGTTNPYLSDSLYQHHENPLRSPAYQANRAKLRGVVFNL